MCFLFDFQKALLYNLFVKYWNDKNTLFLFKMRKKWIFLFDWILFSLYFLKKRERVVWISFIFYHYIGLVPDFWTVFFIWWELIISFFIVFDNFSKSDKYLWLFSPFLKFVINFIFFALLFYFFIFYTFYFFYLIFRLFISYIIFIFFYFFSFNIFSCLFKFWIIRYFLFDSLFFILKSSRFLVFFL